MLIRQGDLILRRVSGQAADELWAHISSAAKMPEVVTLAVGEESGHGHVTDGLVAVRPAPGQPGVLHIQAPTTLRVGGQPWRHDEIPLSVGVYEFWVQRELSEDEDIQNVQD